MFDNESHVEILKRIIKINQFKEFLGDIFVMVRHGLILYVFHEINQKKISGIVSCTTFGSIP